MNETEKNCNNCKYYQHIMSGKGYYHFHDWCEVWRSVIPDGKIDEKGYNDIENGKSWCWKYEIK